MFKRKRSAEDFAEEIQTHLALEADELRAEGLSDPEARRRARVEFGSVQTSQEQFYLKSRWQWLDKLMRDLRFGMRSLLQSPGFALTAILTLALGVGANTAVFSVMNAVLLKSLPVADPDRLVYLRTSNPPKGTGTEAPATRASWLRTENCAMSRSFVSSSPLPLRVTRQTGRLEASNFSTTGGRVPGGSLRSCAMARFEMLVSAASASVPGWK